MRKSVAANIFLLGLGACAGLLACEAFIRVFYRQDAMPVLPFVRHDPWLGWVNRPGEGKVQIIGNDRPVFVRINRQGYRGQEFALEKRKGVKRLIVIGDSVSFGYNLDEEETFPHHMAGALGDLYEVLNMGVIGYGTDQELILLRKEAMRYSPDIVLVGYSTGNDIIDTRSSVRFNFPKPFFRLDKGELVPMNVPVSGFAGIKESLEGKGAGRILMRHSHLYRFIAFRTWLRPYVDKSRSSDAAMSPDEGWQVTEAVVSEMKSICEKAGSRILFVLIPDGWVLDAVERMSVMRGESGSRERIKEILDRNNIPYLDLWTPFFEESAKGQRLYIEGDPDHWNADGNSLAAGFILAWMEDLGLFQISR